MHVMNSGLLCFSAQKMGIMPYSPATDKHTNFNNKRPVFVSRELKLPSTMNKYLLKVGVWSMHGKEQGYLSARDVTWTRGAFLASTSQVTETCMNLTARLKRRDRHRLKLLVKLFCHLAHSHITCTLIFTALHVSLHLLSHLAFPVKSKAL